jgi:hypothetical protein
MSFTFCILQSCSTEDLINNVENDKVALYGAEVNQYFSSLERNSTQEEIADIQKLKGSINKVTLKEYDLHANQKLLIADIMPQDNFRKNSKTKIIFYFFGDEIFRSSIIVFQDDYLAYDYNRTLHTMLSEETKKQFKYTGQVEMFTIKKKLEFRGTLQDGRLIKSAAVRILKKKIKNNARSSGCIDYYLVTTVGNTVVSAQFLYTICDVNNGDTTGGGSGYGGDGSYSSGSFIILPVSPQEDDIHTHRDSDNIVTTYKFIDNVWKITGVVLPDLVLKSGRESNYGFLNFEFPDHDQIVFGDDGLSYKYNSFSGNWTGNEMMLVTDPCSIANNMTKDAQNSTFISTKSNIVIASSDGLEHSITLGRDANGNMTQSTIRTGGQNAVAVNTSWLGAFASLHNHPNNTQLSAGDIYLSVKLNTMDSNFTTSYILTDGQLYAIVVTDLVSAQNFAAAYPADQLPGFNPEFPDVLFNQLQALVTTMGSSIDGKTKAIAYVLNQYNAGITLLKQNSIGEFEPIKPEETINSDGTKSYITKPCN